MVETVLQPFMDLSAFGKATDRLISTGERVVQEIDLDRGGMINAVLPLSKALQERKFVHFVGMGRSGKVATMIGEQLKNLGFRVSFLGKTLARRVREGDVVVAVSGSGATKTTVDYIFESLERNALVIALTSNVHSFLGRLADVVLKIDTKRGQSDIRDYLVDQVNGKRTPLTPMGTEFELTTMLVGSGLIGALYNSIFEKSIPLGKAIPQGFKYVTKEILSSAKETMKIFNNPEESEKIAQLIKLIQERRMGKSEYDAYNAPRIFWIGAGLTDLVAMMCAMRFQHLLLNVAVCFDWRFRKENDVLIVFSGSGETPYTVGFAEKARKRGIPTVAVTSYPESSLARKADITLICKGRKVKVSEFEQPLIERKIEKELFIPGFEYSSAIVLDGIVAQIAKNLGIEEKEMKEHHADIE